MSNNDFDFFNTSVVTSDSSFGSSNASNQKNVSTCGWHWVLTVLCLVLVAGLSFLMAFLTKDVPNRPIWMMGLIFMVPAGAMFLGAMIMEFGTGAMTPAMIRGTQMKIAALATAATMAVGCICDAVYLKGGYVADSMDNLLFLVYERDTKGNSQIDQAVLNVLEDVQKKGGKRVQAGLFIFDLDNQWMDYGDNAVVPMAPFTKDQLKLMNGALLKGERRQTVYYGVEQAYQMVEDSKTDKHTRIIIICDEALTYGMADTNEAVSYLKENNMSLYFMGQGVAKPELEFVVTQSGGSVVNGYDTENVVEYVNKLVNMEGDMLRAQTTSATVLTGIMLLMEGLVIGLGMMLLLSVQGQKRFQVILSPLLAVVSFLLLKVVPLKDIVPQWILEGAAFSLLGLVFMKRNYSAGSQKRGNQKVRVSNEMGFGNTNENGGGFSW